VKSVLTGYPFALLALRYKKKKGGGGAKGGLVEKEKGFLFKQFLQFEKK